MSPDDLLKKHGLDENFISKLRHDLLTQHGFPAPEQVGVDQSLITSVVAAVKAVDHAYKVACLTPVPETSIFRPCFRNRREDYCAPCTAYSAAISSKSDAMKALFSVLLAGDNEGMNGHWAFR